MSYIWNQIDRTNYEETDKYKLSVLALSLIACLAGLMVWLVLRPWCLNSADWAICFMGYPVVCAWVAAYLYTCRHSFHRGTK